MPFLYAAGSQFDEMYVGVGAKRIRKLFEEARYVPTGLAVIYHKGNVTHCRLI